MVTRPYTGCQELDAWLPKLMHLWQQRHKLQPLKLKTTASLALPSFLVAKITEAIRQLSLGLTRERKLVGQNYLLDPWLEAAYLLFFWPVSYIQARYVLQSLPGLPHSMLDLGSGAGPAGMAGFDLGVKHVTFADRSLKALDWAAHLAQSRHRAYACQKCDLQHPLQIKEKYDLIVLQHSLNELWPGEAERILKRIEVVSQLFNHLKPNGRLLIIEPALTITARDLLQLRDGLLKLNLSLIAPCLHAEPCPALQHPNDSCHMERSWTPPAGMKELVRRAGFQKKTLKWVYMLFQKENKPSKSATPDNVFLIVSEPLRSKNRRLRLIGCGTAGRLGLAIKPEELSDTNRFFLRLRRGDIIRVQSAEKLESGWRLLSHSQVELIGQVLPNKI